MRRPLLAAACLLAVAGGWPGSARATAYTFTTIDAPSALIPAGLGNGGYPSGGTVLSGINNQGQIAGYYDNFLSYALPLGTGVYSTYITYRTSRSFVYNAGTFTPVVAPGDNEPSAYVNYGVFYGYNDTGTVVQNINNNGQITGYASFLSNMSVRNDFSFIDTNGVFTIPPPAVPSPYQPGALSIQFHALAVNDAGVVFGIETSSYGSQYYLLSNGIYTPLNINLGQGATTIRGFNDKEQFFGTYQLIDPNEPHYILYHTYNYVDTGGVITTINGTILGISNLGEVVGTDLNGVAGVGFVYDNGVYTTINEPDATGSSATHVNGVNDQGDLVGYYETGDRTTHGFLATPVPVPEPASITMLGMGLAALGVIVRRRRTGALAASAALPG